MPPQITSSGKWTPTYTCEKQIIAAQSMKSQAILPIYFFKVKKKKEAMAKWLVACDEVKLELWGLYPIKKLILSTNKGSLQGRTRYIFTLIISLLIKSESITVPIAKNIHQYLSLLKLRSTNTNIKIYMGTQVTEFRISEKNTSKKELCKWSFIYSKMALSTFNIFCIIIG